MSTIVNVEDARVEIPLPKSLVDRISRRVASSEFKSVSEYVTFVLEQVLAGLETKSTISKEDQEKIEQRLRDLGYL